MTTQKLYQNFDCITIADRHGTVNSRNDNLKTGVVQSVYKIPTFPFIAEAYEYHEII